MNKRKKIIFSLVFLGLLLVVSFFAHWSVASWRWNTAANAAGSMPYQIGLTGVTITKCVTMGTPPICIGAGSDPIATPLCNTKGPAVCTAYSVASGMPAGGMGNIALFLTNAISQAGLTPGGQLIAGGISPVLMDSGVLASAGGCFGCTAKAGAVDKIFAWLDKYIIAGFRKK